MVLNIPEIQKIIPHRYPMLLLDQVIECQPGHSARAIKNISLNDVFVAASSKIDPIFPRPLMIEALAQTGAVALLSEPGFKGKTAYFGGIKKAEFLGDARPGQQLTLITELTKIRGLIGIGKGKVVVDGQKIVEAELTFMIG